METRMTTTIDSGRARFALVVGHVAGMVDMVALPVWVGALVQFYKLDPQQAGAVVTLFLVGVVCASIILAPNFERLPRRWMATIGYAVAALGFYAASTTDDFTRLAVFHGMGGIGLGCGLSFTHGSIGRSANPHRLFAIAQQAAGIFAVVFLAGAPRLVGTQGGYMLFILFALVMLLAAVVMGVAFPVAAAAASIAQSARTHVVGARLSASVWHAIAGVSSLGLNQAMLLSFTERIGMARQFGLENVNAALIAIGLVALLPAVMAALLQKRLEARKVGIVLPLVQIPLALTVTHTHSYALFSAAVSAYVFCTLFTHTFLFGLLAKLDTSGRAVALTPAMLMTGAAIGPILGGTLVVLSGYEAIGYAIAVLAATASFLVSRIVIGQRAPSPAMSVS
jgi:predicted MFS family arabinose efflux permease